MKTETCPHCQKVFTHQTEKSAKFALAMHLSHQHGIRSEKADHARKLKKAREAKKAADSKEGDHKQDVQISYPPKPKRAYVQRAVKQQESGQMIRFCPCCGCNLHAVAVAIRLQG